MPERRMYYRLPTEGAANVFESEFGPVEYCIVEAEPTDPAPDGWLLTHTEVYGETAVTPAKTRKRKAVEQVTEADGDSSTTDDAGA